jgi:hypothetical protein
MGTPWSPQEKRTLKSIWKKAATVESQMSRLPGRTVECAYTMARLLELPVKPRARTLIRAAILKLMKDGQPRTTAQIRESVRADKKVVRDLIASLTAAGELHLTGEYGRYHAAFHKAGQAPADAPALTRARTGDRGAARRAAIAESETEEEVERRLDMAYRSPARWWPSADALVVQSIHAMVAAGRV